MLFHPFSFMGYFPTMVLHKIIGRESITVLKRSKDVGMMDLPQISWILSLLSPAPPPSSLQTLSSSLLSVDRRPSSRRD